MSYYKTFWRNTELYLYEVGEIIDGWSVPQLCTLMRCGVFRIIGENDGSGRVILYQTLPFENGSIILPDERTYDLMRITEGPPDKYDGEIIARFHNCKVRRWWMSRPIAWRSRDQDHVTGYVELDCTIELFPVSAFHEV